MNPWSDQNPKYCVGCHNDQPRPDGRKILDLAAKAKIGWGGFTPSYTALHPYVRRPGPESDYHLQIPLEFHADTSELFLRLFVAVVLGMWIMWPTLLVLWPQAAKTGWASQQPIELFTGAFSLVVLLFSGWPFLRGAWQAARVGKATMDTLVVLGTWTAWLYSAYAALWGLAWLQRVMLRRSLTSSASSPQKALPASLSAFLVISSLSIRARAPSMSSSASCKPHNAPG